ncbi:MAG: prepilin-type N-terminal cleavage/methylation domain-containing protein [Phycisphaeraceae bacterium]|nr:prepilin-type N-terminal cleavage/methylation domain-containing protein [Phycisphaeraceae bacterium]
MKRETGQRGFSLIEMMVVLGILVVVLAIVLPALNAARTAARKSATQSLMNGLQTASSQFTLSERRVPGYFGMQSMADNANTTRGFTTMDNIILDLAGGFTQAARNAPGDACSLGTNPNAVIEVGPTTTDTVRVSLSAIGSSRAIAGVQTKAYFQPDKRYFAAQCINPTKKRASVNPDHLAMPAVIDAFGHPILAWAEDERIAPGREFAAHNGSQRARFYWTPNAAFLTATGLGEFGANQTDTLNGSLLGVSGSAVNLETMAAVFGNPNSPDPSNANVPTESRGKLIFHSAGANGVYLGRRERGGRVAMATGGALQYTTGKDWANDGSFDDIFLVGGN